MRSAYARVSDEVDGILFRPRDPAGVAAGVLRLVEARDLRMRTRAVAAADVRLHFTRAHNAATVPDAYSRAAAA